MLKKLDIFYVEFTLFVLLGILAGATVAEARTIEIEGIDSLKFSVTQISAKPGERLTVKLINKTSLPPVAMSHNFVLLKKGYRSKRIR